MNDLTGKKFNKLTVLSLADHRGYQNQILWICRCDCGNMKEATTGGLTWNNVKSCGCSTYVNGKNSTSWKGYEEISGRHWNIIKKCAEDRNLEFNVTIEYLWDLFLKQNRKCALSGLELKFDTSSSVRDKSASLDRIDSTLGYVVGNVQWVHKDINRMKRDYPDEYFIKICKSVADYRRKK